MSSSRKKYLRHLKEVAKDLEQLKIKQEVRVENNISGLCPLSDTDIIDIGSKIEGITKLLIGLSDSLITTQKDIAEIKDILSQRRDFNE
ncbi:MAG TPA: hypothetical protein VFF14_07545 [Candidatus Deferrimicrobium sp.]|nr:hypothetical protein [Candidatus Deferrimicrobium sp.]